MEEKGAMRSLLAMVTVAALLSAALGGAYSLSEKSWNGGWSFETLENNVNLVAETVLSGWGGGAQDNHSTDNLPADNSPTDNVSDLGFWDTHSLDAVPVVQENASMEDLPTVENVKNIFFKWDVFENERPPVVVDWTSKTFDEVFSLIRKLGLEYHFDENGRLHVDTPGWVYETPSERSDNEYWIANSTMKGGGMSSRNALDFCRHLRERGIANGIAIFEWPRDVYPEAYTVVPVERGLVYFNKIRFKENVDWASDWYAVNVKPSDLSQPSKENHLNTEINLHWRLGKGDYAQWDYVLENGEPTMVWPENGQPVDWKL